MLERGGLGRLAVGSGSARMAGARTSSRWKRGMSNPLSRIATRVAYGASQLPRVAWYIGHSLAMRRLAEAARRRDSGTAPVSYTHLRAHETVLDLVCRLLLEKKKQ